MRLDTITLHWVKKTGGYGIRVGQNSKQGEPVFVPVYVQSDWGRNCSFLARSIHGRTLYPMLLKVYPAIVTATSLPLSAPARREAAALLAEISRKPVLPRIANSSPCVP